jgi:hypothetical protein
MALRDQWPNERAASPDLYEELSAFGAPTGRLVLAAKDEGLPDLPPGFSWRPLSERSVAEIRARAEEFRRMAGTATTHTVRNSLRKLAERLENLANRRKREARSDPEDQ